MRSDDLLKRLEDMPFRPFRVHVSDGSVLDIDQPNMIIVGRTTAVFPTAFRTSARGRRIADDWRTVSLVHITQFSNLDLDDHDRN